MRLRGAMRSLQTARGAALSLGLLAGLSALVYLAFSWAGGYLGYPLDDAWIHQTYARNLGQRGEFAFVPGEASAGSTAPLWTALLALGYALRLEPRAWTYALGVSALAATAWLVRALVLRLAGPAHTRAAWLAGAFTVLEWHLAWAAVSGMETLLFSLLALLALHQAAQHPGRAGLAVGLSVLARPDGLLLLPLGLVLSLGAASAGGASRAPALLRPVLRCLAGFALTFGPYLLLNQWLAGTPWPNTFYAKQAEYAVLRAAPLWRRVLAVGLQPWVGAQALLLPAVLAVAWRGARQRNWLAWALLAWLLAVVAAYALRLPVTYQHGRYLVPVIPAAIVLGFAGLAQVLRLRASRAVPRVLSRAWALALAALGVALWLIGAGSYTRDVQIIESEMVAAARWVSRQTEPGALVAAHDIGALGYFGGRRLLDLAGLVTPEVIPILRDEAQLAAWLDDQGADYLVTFPGWYPSLVQPPHAERVYATGAPFSPAAQGENMAVYRWRPDTTPAGAAP